MEAKQYLYLVWKDPLSRRNYTVGKLSKGTGYTFEYYGEYLQAKDVGWDYIKSFPNDVKYHSEVLFPAFSSRLPDKKRKDIVSVLTKYGLSEYNGFDLLRKSGGRLPIDNYEFVEPIVFCDNVAIKEFYVVGIRHVSRCLGKACQYLPQLSNGMQLSLVPEPNNKHDTNAILVKTIAGDSVGYVPRYYSKDVASFLKTDGKYECVVVEKNNEKNCQECVKVKLVMSKV